MKIKIFHAFGRITIKFVKDGIPFGDLPKREFVLKATRKEITEHIEEIKRDDELEKFGASVKFCDKKIGDAGLLSFETNLQREDARDLWTILVKKGFEMTKETRKKLERGLTY